MPLLAPHVNFYGRQLSSKKELHVVPFFRYNRLSCLLLVCSQDLQCGQGWLKNTLHEEELWCLTKYFFPTFSPRISLLLLSKYFSRFSSRISTGPLILWPKQAFPHEEHFSCSTSCPVIVRLRIGGRGGVTMFRDCMKPAVIAISIYEWVVNYEL